MTLRRVLLSLFAVVGMLGWPSAAQAHTGGDASVRPVLDEVPAELDGLDIRLAYSAAYQLVLSNPTDEPIEVLDPDGTPFLRIGPDGVLGNLNARGWYTTNDPFGQTPVPQELEDRLQNAPVPPARWGRVSREPSWGWFDHRLHPVTPSAPRDVVEAGVPVDLETWVVPVRYRGRTLELKGRIRYEPLRGGFRFRLAGGDSRATIADGVEVAIVETSSIPGLFLANKTGEEVVVLGPQDEPFLRFSTAGVEANMLSPQWLEVLRSRGQAPPNAEADADAEPQWVLQTSQQAFPWPELRAALGTEEPAEDVVRLGVPVDVLDWRIPILVGGTRHMIEGVTEWVPREALVARMGRATEPARAGLTPSQLRGGLAALALVALGGFEIARRRRPAVD